MSDTSTTTDDERSFLTAAFGGATEAEWALLGVKASFEAVLEPYQKFARLKKRQPNVPIRLSVNGDEVPRVTAVVQVKGSPWTIILCSIFYVRQTHLKHIKGAVEELSRADSPSRNVCRHGRNGVWPL